MNKKLLSLKSWFSEQVYREIKISEIDQTMNIFTIES